MGKITQNQNFWRKLIAVLTLAITTGLLVIFINFQVNAVVRKQGTENREQEKNIQLSNIQDKN